MMSKNIVGKRNIPGMQATDIEDCGDMNIYENVNDINSHDVCRGTEDTARNQTSQLKGSECARNRSHRSVLVCLVVLCVLLLTAVIVLCVLIYTNNHEFHNNNKNITEERDQLLTKYTNITQERDQLLTKYTNITEERDQLLTKYTNITEERDQLLTKYTNITEERDELRVKYNHILKQSERLNQEKTELTTHLRDGWIYYRSSFYFISSEKKSWTESRSYCTQRGADLIIINNKDEQEFVCKMSDEEIVWIGLSDSDVEGRWKWVDGSTLTSGFWGENEPGGQRRENCAVKHFSLWADYPCTDAFKCICEKKNVLSKLLNQIHVN
ncbi:asialoglycoprotein receptor 1-like isoform X1 [Triplophysa dalaica]|uniref:asialoglycoprotein receptor 1-like isoform X1 n=1 Tax=Triplophysa dalaica TaxID=1582913 RepID=UPI0024DFFB6A|nr:asialoglycoprotein receptor 1-like isoform X1 [Triplophysa dalaica]